jgi:hypothetical protein
MGTVQAAMDVAPYIKAGRTYLPVRYVAYSLGIDDEHIQWDNETRKVTLTLGHVIVQIQIDSNVYNPQRAVIHPGRGPGNSSGSHHAAHCRGSPGFRRHC